MKFKYITIEREYGSGGSAVARVLAEMTGVACYGREILEIVSKETLLLVRSQWVMRIIIKRTKNIIHAEFIKPPPYTFNIFYHFLSRLSIAN